MLPPLPSRPSLPSRPLRLLVALAGAFLVVGGALPGARVRPAAAVVVHQLGYQATVEGWTSWYGSYGMGSIGAALNGAALNGAALNGPAWCIDHGIAAPDPAYGYAPTTIADHSPDTVRAMAWALGRYGPEADRPTAAALTIVLHDLAGATYPQGRIDVDHMTAGRLAGFAGAEAEVLDRARHIKADAVAHAGLIPPLRLTAARDTGGPDVVARVTDRDGRPVPGVDVTGPVIVGSVSAGGSVSAVRTDATGRARISAGGPSTGPMTVAAVFPDLTLTAWAPSRAVAQRVARPGRGRLQVTVPALAAPTTTTSAVRPTTTTTTAAPATTTAAAPTTTTTAAPTTTTTVRPTTTTTAAPTTTTTVRPTTTTTAAPTTTSTTTAAPVPVAAASVIPVATPVAPALPTSAPQLPFTGTPVRSLSMIGLGLALLGMAALLAS